MAASKHPHGYAPIMDYMVEKGRKAPAVWPPSDGLLYGYVGQLAVAWGGFEGDLNAMLDAILFKAGEDPRRAHIGPFRTRKALFRQHMVSVFETCPTICATLDRMLNEAAQLHWRRNIVLHGEIRTGATDGSGVLKAVGEHNGKLIELEYGAESLRAFLMRVGHMHGLLDAIGEDPEPPSHERQFVRAFLRSAHPHSGGRGLSPIPHKQPPLP
ncbi:hypothetical protein [Phenylobacterium sp.]|uniref:hypothetical protein n=1 Tax=Phenylobacterium sp. TaxID=1871053 RepID=UPI002733426A|nr:hypothetical protein [Phenylobacterium sp.]MDP3660791.1 hypothetical protein [Phenylobacterium sp.]